MVIIKCNTFISSVEFTKLWEGFVKMAKTGVILLPLGCDLLNEVPPDTEICMVKPGDKCGAMPVEEFIAYIDKAIKERLHGDSFWIDEREHTHGADVGYAWEWWMDCMRPELLRVFGDRRADQ